MTAVSTIALLVMILPVGYLVLMALASLRAPSPRLTWHEPPATRFVIAIPAHNEQSVIGETVARLLAVDYPKHLFSVHVVADHCSDQTATMARDAGGVVHERNDGPRTGKGEALAWLFKRVLAGECDAVVIFDSDTEVAPDFLRVMDARLAEGCRVIQGQHVISNPEDGWFPALTAAMFLIDNRYQNLGRTNLGWSAKHMGDSICFRADVLRGIGWGEGLTEDYELRQRLLLEGVSIAYEPAAKGFGEAPRTWSQARAQRARWLRGTRDASRNHARQLIVQGIRRRSGALLDGALQACLPSYSSLALISTVVLAAQVLVKFFAGPLIAWYVIAAWAAIVGLLFLYPLLGLALEAARTGAYVAILAGPFFIVWRTWLAVVARFGSRPAVWIRTAHREPL